MEEKTILQKEEPPIDLVLHTAINENVKLINKLQPLVDMITWIKFFIIFVMLALMLVVMRYFGLF